MVRAIEDAIGELRTGTGPQVLMVLGQRSNEDEDEGEENAVFMHVGDAIVRVPMLERRPGHRAMTKRIGALERALDAAQAELAGVAGHERIDAAGQGVNDLLRRGVAQEIISHFHAGVSAGPPVIPDLTTPTTKLRDVSFELLGELKSADLVGLWCGVVVRQLEAYPFVALPSASPRCTVCERGLSDGEWSYASDAPNQANLTLLCFGCAFAARARAVTRALFAVMAFENRHLLQLFPRTARDAMRARFTRDFDEVVTAVHRSLVVHGLIDRERQPSRAVPRERMSADEYAHEIVEVVLCTLGAVPAAVTKLFAPRVVALKRRRARESRG